MLNSSMEDSEHKQISKTPNPISHKIAISENDSIIDKRSGRSTAQTSFFKNRNKNVSIVTDSD